MDLKLNGRSIGDIFPLFSTMSVDEYVVHDLLLTSNQSGLSISYGGVATGQTIFVKPITADRKITASLNNVTAVILSGGMYMHYLTSFSTLTLTNDQTNNTVRVLSVILGT